MEIKKYSDFEKLEIIHIFDYYDFPLFFVSKSPINEYYLNYYVEELEESTDKWIFGRISSKECTDLMEHRLSVLTLLNHLFKKRRLHYLFMNPAHTQPDSILRIELVDANNFDPESFPEDDFFVEYDYVTEKELVKIEEDIIDSSKFKMVLKDDENRHDIGLDLFVDMLSNLKESINDIAYDIGSKLMGQKPEHAINLRIDSLQPSSFGVWLKAEPLEADLFEVPEKSLNNLFELIDDIKHKSPSEIKEQIDIDEEYSIETIKSVKNMLKDIADNEFSLTLEANTKVQMTTKEVKFDKESYNKLSILNTILKEKSEKHIEEIEIEGVLTSINTSYNKFRIVTTTIGEISGRMSTEMFRELKKSNNLQFKVPSLIKATINKENVKDYLEEEFYEKYTLVKFEQPE
ncbi:hypothetical protein POL82_04300 [Priestia aryabhattai]|uniref:DUF6575 domain-containing protein n=1 Tax=Priestia TaxID=2800373 RepID=UPI00234ED9D4|nr:MULTISPECIES: DUF6575 domain-containing protein [Priestia]MDC7762670.1 hypothetical protein [Priestia aryabhattai]MED3980874.1 hypothetical protein [Priestia megaterium]